ncbi:pimeloyl-ACP methyl ester carboxylesterase [Caballeronia udeis]|uniref:Pimeloyl-ACP methyl ester carboxylesterase n=1 Tax=Caballeronia udeis TaxID=1232866 RepID=A0ABW8N0Z2_9BURK
MTLIFLSIIAVGVIVIAGLVIFSLYIAHRVEQALPPQGRFINIGADRIHYVEYGNGPPVVFVHGLSGQLRNFAYLHLNELAQTHRVILIDRPGSGHSTRGASSSASIPAQARTVAMFIDAMGLNQPVLVGHSLGGAIALAVGLNHPDSVSRLALIAPLTHLVEAGHAFGGLLIRSPLVRRIVAVTVAIPFAIKGSRSIMDIVFGPDSVPKDFAMKGGGLLGLRPRSFYAASSDLMAIADELPAMETRYASLRLPVDVLYGREDRILDWRSHGEALKAKLDRTNLRLVDGGHMLPVTAPAVTMEWLREIAGEPLTTPASPIAQ